MNAFLDLHPGGWSLVVAHRAANVLMLELVAHLARRGAVRVIDGGDRFKAHFVARALARGAPVHARGPDLSSALARIHLARAFTCYQMATLLEETLVGPAPCLVLDFLATFYDESVPLVESRRLLAVCLTHLARLSHRAPLAVSARPPRGAPARRSLLEQLELAAQRVWHLEPHQPPPAPRLFDDQL